MTKYVNNNGVSEMWLNIKNWVTSQLLGYSQTGHTHSASDITSGLSTVATSGSYNDLSNKPTIPTVNNATLTIQKNGTTVKTFTANASSNVTANITVPTKTSDLTNDSGFLTSHQDLSGYIPLSGTNALSGSIIPSTDNACDLGNSTYNFKNVYAYKLILKNSYIVRTANNDYLGLCGGTDYSNGAYFTLYGKDSTINSGGFRLRANDGTNSKDLIGKPDGTLTWGSKNVAMREDVIPRSGGAVLTGTRISKTTNRGELSMDGGTGFQNGATITLYGKNNSVGNGSCTIYANDGANPFKAMWLYGTGTWMWNGTAVQITSDQRLKQQISEIDDKLLDAWEDVNLVQFKYNDAVKEKSDNARLHTGYVVQQVDEACKSHGVDVSKYGLYCHEEYAEETREVEQADGTKKTEVVRPANEHYSLRYTEALIVECAYLRKKNKELQEQLDKLSARLDKLESASSK